MKMVVMSVFDVASGVFARPIFVASVGSGVRMFSDEANRKAEDNVMFRHPTDFQLFELGSFDDNAGTFELLDRPMRRAVASDLVM
jgi:hypothetical protein